MRNLLNFLWKYNYWFLFLLLEVASFVLLFRFNRYQQSVFFTSANGAVGAIYKAAGGIGSYFHLKTVNEDLLDRNVWLEQRIEALEEELAERGMDSLSLHSLEGVASDKYRIYRANVIKNSLNRVDNYLTLDRGSADSIRPEMGVVDANGVVGIVYKTSPHYSLVISLHLSEQKEQYDSAWETQSVDRCRHNRVEYLKQIVKYAYERILCR